MFNVEAYAATAKEICAGELARIDDLCRELGSVVYQVCQVVVTA